MRWFWKRFWQEEHGFILSSELVLIGSTLVIGGVVGLSSLRDSVNEELSDVAEAIGSVDQTYYYSGVAGHGAYTAGSAYFDQADRSDRRIKVCADVFGPAANKPQVVPKDAPAPKPARPEPAPPAKHPTPPPQEHRPHGPPPEAHRPHGHASHCEKCGATVNVNVSVNVNGCQQCGPAPAVTTTPVPCRHHPAPVAAPAEPCRSCQTAPVRSTMPGAPADCDWRGFHFRGVPEGQWWQQGSKISFPPPGAHFLPGGVGPACGPKPQPRVEVPHHHQHHHHRQPACPDDAVQVRVTDGTNDDLRKVSQMRNVVVLKVDGPGVTNEGVEVLRSLTLLRVLHLNHTRIDDGATVFLATLGTLEELQIVGGNLSDAGLVPLKSLRDLRRLHLAGTRVTEAGLQRLQNALPETEITTGDPRGAE